MYSQVDKITIVNSLAGTVNLDVIVMYHIHQKLYTESPNFFAEISTFLLLPMKHYQTHDFFMQPYASFKCFIMRHIINKSLPYRYIHVNQSHKQYKHICLLYYRFPIEVSVFLLGL